MPKKRRLALALSLVVKFVLLPLAHSLSSQHVSSFRRIPSLIIGVLARSLEVNGQQERCAIHHGLSRRPFIKEKRRPSDHLPQTEVWTHEPIGITMDTRWMRVSILCVYQTAIFSSPSVPRWLPTPTTPCEVSMSSNEPPLHLTWIFMQSSVSTASPRMRTSLRFMWKSSSMASGEEREH